MAEEKDNLGLLPNVTSAPRSDQKVVSENAKQVRAVRAVVQQGQQAAARELGQYARAYRQQDMAQERHHKAVVQSVKTGFWGFVLGAGVCGLVLWRLNRRE